MSGGDATGTCGGGGRVARALRLLVLLVGALAFARTHRFHDTRPLTARRLDRLGGLRPDRTQHRTSSPKPNTDDQDLIHRNILTTNIHFNKTANVTTVLDGKNETLQTTSSTVWDLHSASDGPSYLLPVLLKSDSNGYLNTSKESLEVGLPQCTVNISALGPILFNKTIRLNLKSVDRKYPEVQSGGRYAPKQCRAKDKVAIVVPFRDRDDNLAIFLDHLHPFLMKQQIDYGIFVVEQNGKKPFNRGKLLNVGFVEALNSRPDDYDCYVFHDVDLIPLDTRNLYSCPKHPRHMSAAIDKFKFKLPFTDIFGGVSALTVAQFIAVNGFSNKYWGWGGEDDDMNRRIWKKQYAKTRYPLSIARYVMLGHKPQTLNPKRYHLMAHTEEVFHQDGLTSLKYVVIQTTNHHLYTHILVDIDEKQ